MSRYGSTPDGWIPNIERKTRLKCAESANPADAAAVVRSCPLRNASTARRTRFQTMNLRNGIPTCSAKLRLSWRGDSPTCAATSVSRGTEPVDTTTSRTAWETSRRHRRRCEERRHRPDLPGALGPTRSARPGPRAERTDRRPKTQDRHRSAGWRTRSGCARTVPTARRGTTPRHHRTPRTSARHRRPQLLHRHRRCARQFESAPWCPGIARTAPRCVGGSRPTSPLPRTLQARTRGPAIRATDELTMPGAVPRARSTPPLDQRRSMWAPTAARRPTRSS